METIHNADMVLEGEGKAAHFLEKLNVLEERCRDATRKRSDLSRWSGAGLVLGLLMIIFLIWGYLQHWTGSSLLIAGACVGGFVLVAQAYARPAFQVARIDPLKFAWARELLRVLNRRLPETILRFRFDLNDYESADPVSSSSELAGDVVPVGECPTRHFITQENFSHAWLRIKSGELSAQITRSVERVCTPARCEGRGRSRRVQFDLFERVRESVLMSGWPQSPKWDTLPLTQGTVTAVDIDTSELEYRSPCDMASQQTDKGLLVCATTELRRSVGESHGKCEQEFLFFPRVGQLPKEVPHLSTLKGCFNDILEPPRQSLPSG